MPCHLVVGTEVDTLVDIDFAVLRISLLGNATSHQEVKNLLVASWRWSSRRRATLLKHGKGTRLDLKRKIPEGRVHKPHP